jgi:hypothetical protein
MLMMFGDGIFSQKLVHVWGHHYRISALLTKDLGDFKEFASSLFSALWYKDTMKR